MGFLTEGSTFTWEEATERPVDFVKRHGVEEFLSIYNKLKNRTRDSLRWGDEVEYIVVQFDHENKKVYLSLRGHEVIEDLSKEDEFNKEKAQPTFLWRPEYARFMIEGTPGQPFGSGGVSDLINMETSMVQRRETIMKKLKNGEAIVTIPNFPHLGAIQFGQYMMPGYEPRGPVARSVFTPDEIIHPHFRFSTLTANIRQRRGSKVEINAPIFRDKNTPKIIPNPPSDPEWPSPPPKEYNIYMDSMAFGMGCCCLQCTFQCCNINEARHLYDQLAVLSPIMLALSVGTPILRGYLADTDARWYIIAQSVDDRSEEERGLKPLVHDKFVINKSRYDSIDCYISRDPRLKPEYNDIDLVYDKDVCSRLINGGVDELLARHIAHLFIRDPLVIYRDKLKLDDENRSDHFENIQSTNWQTVRFKPPPPNSSIGWRVEFRPLEIQLTDFENAAFSVFIVLLTRIIVSFDVNFYIPLSKVDENIQTAHKRDAVVNEKFYFRKCVRRGDEACGDEYDLMTINEIMNGKQYEDGFKFTGIVDLVRIYLDTINVEKRVADIINNYLDFISKKASGELKTTASWIRNFVTSHPDYKQDSVVTPQINYDLMNVVNKISNGELFPPDLLGDFAQKMNNTKST